jgi:hypothetical protein
MPLMCRLLWAAFWVGWAVLAVERQAAAEEKERFFYHGYDYGSQATFNPLSVFINGSYDVLQIRAGRRNIFSQEYKANTSNVAENLFVHPFRSVSEEGWGKFLKEEVFPLSYTAGTARWVPNYTLHLFGGGVTYRALWEWYDDHSVPAPWLFSATTIMAYHFLNEVVENKEVVGRNTDCIADFWIFDLGSIALFSFRSVSRFFSQSILLADWSLQPSLTYPGFDLHNQGQYFAAKWPLPLYPRVRLFGYAGMAQLAGLSYKTDSEYSITAAGGMRSTRFANQTNDSVHDTVQFEPSVGLFVDRNESLLASLQVSAIQDYFIHLNVYPNAFWRTDPGVGFWTVADRTGHVIVGLSVRLLGMGVGYGKL